MNPDRTSLSTVRGAAPLAGLLCAAALVWYAGPLVSIAGVAPLAGEAARWTGVAALGASALALVLWRRWRQSLHNRRLMEGLLADPDASPGDKEVALLTRRFEQAVRLLRRSRIGGRRSWLAALGGLPYVYQLPWYVIIGAPGAGKTTALVNSGLEFPLAAEMGKDRVRGIGGTRHCDWWFTSSAVLIDTAGRYTTQASDRAADSRAWLGFLDLLVKHRPRRPVNGVLLAVSASDLLNASPERRRANADELRQRILELHDRLGLGIPVYVLVTKTDLLAGFMEFFADFDKDERAQVWGMTFETGPGSAGAAALAEDPGVRMVSEFAALEKRLNDCMLERLHGERDRERRAAIHAFPQQWRLLRQALIEFMSTLLEGMPPTLRPLVRGVYFTSATQEGTPMDRALGGMARALGLAHRVIPPARPTGKTFFVTRLLRDVVFAEAELAGTNLRWRRQRAAMAWAASGLLLCGVLAGAAFSWHAFSVSRDRVDALNRNLPGLQRAAEASRRADADDLVALLPLLDALSGFGRGDAAGRAGGITPAAFTLGLDRGETVAVAAQDAYRRALREAFLPRIALRLERRLRAGEREHVELIYETLRAYLMLFAGRQFDANALRASLRADWDATLPPRVTPAERASLARHLDQLLATGEVGAPSRADAALIQRARALVASVPLPQRAYRRLVQMSSAADGSLAGTPAGSGAGGALPGSLAGGMLPGTFAGGTLPPGAGATPLFVRASAAPLTQGIGGFYSRAAAGPALRERTRDVLRQFAREQSWVLGTTSPALVDPASQQKLIDEVQRLYLADYAARWSAFIADLRLAPTASVEATAEQVLLLARSDSPLATLMRTLVHELAVDGLDTTALAGSGTGVRVVSGSGTGERALAAAGPGELDVVSLKRYVVDDPTGLEATLALLGRLATHLSAVADAARRHTLPPASDALRALRAAAARAPEPVHRLLSDLADEVGTQSFALLREPLARELATKVAPACASAIGGRFPIVGTSADDMSREDFARLFAADGLLDGFFQTQLAPYVDTAAPAGSTRSSPAAARSVSDEAQAAFQRAETIRQSFFSEGGRRLGTRLEFRLLDMDPGLREFTLEIDGQPMRFRAGSRAASTQAVQWPGAGAQREVRLQVQPSGSSGYVFNGPWALFRLLQRVRVERGAAPDRALLLFDVEGRKARFEVKSAGASNPLLRQELEQFQCPKRL